MADQDIVLEVDGTPFEFFTAVTVYKNLETLSGQFSFSATSSPLQELPIKNGALCRVLIKNKPVISGYVERISVAYDANSHSITISGRDKTADIVDSTIDGSKLEFTDKNTTLTQIIEKVISILNINDIGVIDESDAKPFGAGSIESAAAGETAFDFIEKYATKRQVLLTSDGNGNIVIRNKSSGTYKTVLSSSATTESNILSATKHFNSSKRFHEYNVVSQQNTSALLSELLASSSGQPAKKAANIQSKPILDDAIRDTRTYTFIPGQSCDTDQSTKRAQWERDYRRSKSLSYKVVVVGAEPKDDVGEIWQINKLVNVVDDYSAINTYNTGALLIGSVHYSYDIDGGFKTSLELYEKDGFTLRDEQPKAEPTGDNNFAKELDALLTKKGNKVVK